jgi:hypothetical protein
LVEGIKRYNQALSPGVPGLPSSEGIKNVIEHEVKIPLKIEGDIAPEKILNLRLMQQVKIELENQKSPR